MCRATLALGASEKGMLRNSEYLDLVIQIGLIGTTYISSGGPVTC